MQEQFALTNEEWALIAELIERERGELPAEIRRCMISTAHDDLQVRLRLVESLLAKVKRRNEQTAA